MQEASLFDLFLVLRDCSLIGYDCLQGVVRVGEAVGEGGGGCTILSPLFSSVISVVGLWWW